MNTTKINKTGEGLTLGLLAIGFALIALFALAAPARAQCIPGLHPRGVTTAPRTTIGCDEVSFPEENLVWFTLGRTARAGEQIAWSVLNAPDVGGTGLGYVVISRDIRRPGGQVPFTQTPTCAWHAYQDTVDQFLIDLSPECKTRLSWEIPVEAVGATFHAQLYVVRPEPFIRIAVSNVILAEVLP